MKRILMSGGLSAASINFDLSRQADILIVRRTMQHSRSGHSITSAAQACSLIRATPLSENPQSPASRLIARPERSTTIL